MENLLGRMAEVVQAAPFAAAMNVVVSRIGSRSRDFERERRSSPKEARKVVEEQRFL